MRKEKKYFYRTGTAALLSFTLLLPALSGFSVQAADGAMTGDGTAESPYIIEDQTDLMKFVSIVNEGRYDASGKLASDISVTGSWTPIGGTDPDTAYTGLFDGNSHTVTFTGLASGENQGLFAYSSGTIRNVTVEGSFTAEDYAGGISAVNYGKIINCTNEADIAVTAPVSFAGGIAGVNIGTIEKSRNTGAISSSASGANVGGIAGAAREGRIADCSSTGRIVLEPEDSDADYTEGCAGGIAGLNYKALIERSGNYGTVSGKDANGYSGGITGLNNGSITDCINGAEIEGAFYAGGIAGYNFLNEDAGNADIHNALNHGNISANNTGYGAVCGVNSGGTVYDNYYLDTTAAAGVGADDNNGTTPVTAAALAGGEITYRLNGNQSSAPVWYQTLSEDSFPVLDSSRKVVYIQNTDGNIVYTNEYTHTDHTFNDQGICTGCGYHSASLFGHSLTLDGAIGLNYYYYIDPIYYQDGSYTITASFTVNGRTETDTFDPGSVLATGNSAQPQVYGFQLYLNSDEMTSPVSARLEITKNDEAVVTLSDEKSFYAYDYLKELYSDENHIYTKELQDLAQALAAHDYYANEYFRYRPSYEPEIPRLPLDSVTQETLAAYKQTVEDQGDYPAKHYALSVQFLTRHILYLYISSEEPLDTERLYMGYRADGSADTYTYVQAQKYGSYYRGATEKIPASELDTMWNFAFFLKEDDGTYRQITPVKTAGALSYVASALRTGTNEDIKQLAQAMYLYHQAAKTYFDSISQE